MLMKMLSRAAMVLMVVGLLVGCTSKAKGGNNEPADRKVSVVDAYGNTIEVGEIDRAVVFDFGILDIMTYAQVDVELALPVASIPAYLSQYKDATMAGSIKEPDMEAIFEFEPDVIIISARQADFYDELSEIAPTIYVDLRSDAFLEDFSRNANIVATLFDKKEQVDKGISEINAIIDDAKALASNSSDKALILLTNDGALSVYGAGSRFGLIHDVIGIPQADEGIEVSTHGQEANFEYISHINPDVLYVIDRTQIAGGTTGASSTLDNALVNGTKAAQNNKIVYLNPEAWYLSSGGMASVKTMVEEIKASLQ